MSFIASHYFSLKKFHPIGIVGKTEHANKTESVFVIILWVFSFVLF